jgi:hypothetical protein
MHRKDLNERSPLRLLEQSIHGGLGRGNIGVVAARRGLGKSAVLVGIALDDLMRGRKVLHVALDERFDKIRDYYDEIFMELARSGNLQDVDTERREIEQYRNIHTFVSNSFSIARLREAITFLNTYMNFYPAALILEGYRFEQATKENMDELRQIAREIDGELWMSAITHRDSIDVILAMEQGDKSVTLRLLKDHSNPNVSPSHVALDPTTLLLIQE